MTTSTNLDDESDLDAWADEDEDDWHEDDLDPAWSESPRARATDPRTWLGDDEDDDW